MRHTLLFPLVTLLALSSCSTALERQAGTAAKGDCWRQADAYIQANLAYIANEWREHEKYKYYQRCLVKQANAS